MSSDHGPQTVSPDILDVQHMLASIDTNFDFVVQLNELRFMFDETVTRAASDNTLVYSYVGQKSEAPTQVWLYLLPAENHLFRMKIVSGQNDSRYDLETEPLTQTEIIRVLYGYIRNILRKPLQEILKSSPATITGELVACR